MKHLFSNLYQTGVWNECRASFLQSGLHGWPILYLFYETPCYEWHRDFFEHGLGLPVIENQFHPPHHRHGLVKYDAGPTIISLNLAALGKFSSLESDAFSSIFGVSDRAQTLTRLDALGMQLTTQADLYSMSDQYGHHFGFETNLGYSSEAAHLKEVHLVVRDLKTSVEFYRDVLGLSTEDERKFRTGSIDIILASRSSAVDGRHPRYQSYLLVFHASPIQPAFEALAARGVKFISSNPVYSAIGGTARFLDPDGHVYCLYEPSPECLTWGSGAKVRELVKAAPLSSKNFPNAYIKTEKDYVD